jgi:hypothetical protein
MSNMFSMFGKDDDGNPTVAANVTVEEAKQIAAAKNLNGMLLAPQAPGNGSHRTYIRNSEGKYKVVRMHIWLTANLTTCTGAEVLEKAADA